MYPPVSFHFLQVPILHHFPASSCSDPCCSLLLIQILVSNSSDTHEDILISTHRYPAAETVKNHIKLLHDYNDIRDVGQGLVGMIADNRGVRLGELYEEFGVGLKD